MTRLESLFEHIGKGVVTRPFLSIVLSLIVAIGLSMGNLILETEGRAERLWIPNNAPSLGQKGYVDSTYPSSIRFNSFIATCKDGVDCNMLEAEYVQSLGDIMDKLNTIVIDGDTLREKANLGLADISDDVWDPKMAGQWSYEGNRTGTVQRKCFAPGPVCLGSSILTVFRGEDDLDTLTDKGALLTVQNFDKRKVFCPLSITRMDSPCFNATVFNRNASATDCIVKGPSFKQRANCEKSMSMYCAQLCPNATSSTSCRDFACSYERSGWYRAALLDLNIPDPTQDSRDPPIASLASSGKNGPARDSNNNVVSAKALQVTMFLSFSPVFNAGSEKDPVAEEWENAALCAIGYQARTSNTVYINCKKDDTLNIIPFFSRSIGDEFSSEIGGDIPLLSIPYPLVLIYLIVMLSRRDHVHSMIMVGLTSFAIVFLAYFGCLGCGGLVGIFNTNLTGTLPLLLLGLGVDDAFVIVGEYERYYLANPKSNPKERVIAASKNGGVSILITSLTDALAFLIGSTTVLPALSYFCIMAGCGVILCFIFQLTILLPVLYLNALRSDANKWDCICCCGPKEEHPFATPKGCCGCCNCAPERLEIVCGKVGTTISAGWPRIVVLAVFAGLLGAGIAGMVLIETNFEFEWFLPAESYALDYFDLNKEYFEGGVNFFVYTQDVNYFDRQMEMKKINTFLVGESIIDKTERISDWHQAFLDSSNTSLLTTDGVYTDENEYYSNLLSFFIGGNGGGEGPSVRGNVKWVDVRCNTVANMTAQCDYIKGLNGARIGATLTLQATTGGVTRYGSLVTLREGLGNIMRGVSKDKQPFPYSTTFFNWEEVGVIGAELLKNLLVTGGVVIVIILALIPHPRIAIFVILSIVLSIVNLVGYMHWWGLTVNGVSTIYILLSCGLAVDYSAHIAHMFVISTGTSQERVAKAMTRIGPSVFNGIVSTFIAVIFLNFTTTYVFQVFARALALTVFFGGSHGLLLLPAMLSIFGGSNLETTEGKVSQIDLTPAPIIKDETTEGRDSKGSQIALTPAPIIKD